MKFFITSVLLSLSGYLLHHIVDAAESNPYSMTTLEQVINRAFVAKLEDRTWQRVFGQGSSGSYVLPDLLPQPICGGGSIEDWPLPASVADESKRESDLARVLESGVFTCGYLSNLIHETRTLNGDNTVLIGTNSTGYVWGIIPEFWQEMISFVSSELPAANAAAWNLQWKLYSTPQETLNALAAGEIDALCGNWGPAGTYNDPFDNTPVARAYAFHLQTCPMYLQKKFVFVYANNSAGVTDFPSLVAAVQTGTISNICVGGLGAFVLSCTSTLGLYSGGVSVNCTGYREGAFDAMAAGDCEGVWDTVVPSNLDSSVYTSLTIPERRIGAGFFRPKDLSPKGSTSATLAEPIKSAKTSLEVAAINAYESLVGSDRWFDFFGGISGIEPTDYCTGQPQYWPPPVVPETKSDLAKMLDNGIFTCGYSENFVAYASDGQVLIDSRNGNITGLIPSFWAALVQQIGASYNKDLALVWVITNSSKAVFDLLNDGVIDSACGFWYPSGTWQNPEGTTISRPLAFSMFQCPSFFLDEFVYTMASSNIDTFDLFAQSVDDGTITSVCVSDDEFGGIVAVCQGAIAQYTTGGNGTCFGAPIGVPDVESWAFDSLTNGTCQAVWSGTPQPNSSSTFNVFPRPTKVAPTSFFRATDLTSPPVTTTGTTTGTSTTTSGDTTSAGPSTSAGISHRNLRTRFVWVAALAFTACWPLLY